MRWTYFIVLQLAIIAAVVGLVYKHQDNAVIIKTPPKSLAQWYKPANKRHVWLHNMFNLRREMQAVAFYAEQQDEKHLHSWVGKLNEHYSKISTMVPQWQNKLDLVAMKDLSNASAALNYVEVLHQLERVQESCDSCHNDYQAITALTYRAPNFKPIQVTQEHNFIDHMNLLTQQVNQVKIASQDGFTELALQSVDELKLSMVELGQVCTDCHKKDRREYPDKMMNKTLNSLKTAIGSGTAKEQGRYLGTLAVLACARCHGTHRIVHGIKDKLNERPSFSELVKH
ncbi:hypothetical protein [Thalassotalea atypica]|uniref:hypothetical protein n=1 Tax=Thalassotalea atypica TaxID=2054316 RepID=UPI00257255D6|nr:hypothetical protein [Thalassotalea atypica]